MILLRQKLYARVPGPNNEVWTNLGGRLENSLRRSGGGTRNAILERTKTQNPGQYKTRLREMYAGGPNERFRLPKRSNG